LILVQGNLALNQQGESKMEMNTATQAAPKKSRRKPTPLNGVNTPLLFDTINAVKGQPELAEFQFRATNRWIAGTFSRTTIDSFSGAGGEHQHAKEFSYEGDHPQVLVGADNAPTPVEFLLHALASCITAGIGNIAAARGIRLESVESRIEGDLNLLGLLGISDEVRNGYQGIRISFDIKGDASAEELRAIVEQGKDRSAVYDVLTNGVPVELNIQS
jgi:uncharacterized OsmC-like protein